MEGAELLLEAQMNLDVVEGTWKQMKGKVREHWGKLTHDHLGTMRGHFDQLAGEAQEARGVAKDAVKKQVKPTK